MTNSDRVDGGQRVQPLVDGTSRNSESTEFIEVINPSNGGPCLNIPIGCDADVNHAVSSARRAFEGGCWSEAPPSLRRQVLHRFADLITSKSSILDALDAEEMGKPVREVFCNAASAAGLMRFFAEAVDKLTGDVYPSDKNSLIVQRLVPRGVVAAIVPWNFPTYVTVLKLAPALAAGNCLVLKPSELASRSGLYLAQLALEAGLPAGVLNVVPGLGQTVGKALALHMDVDMVTFTGSTAVGKQMLQYAGQSNMKVVMAECGGKSPHLVFADGVDLDRACESIARLLLTNQGQICTVGSRLLVHRSIEREVVENVSSRLKDIVMGDARNPETTFGPLASGKQTARVMQYIDTAEEEGAQLVTGGRRVRLESGGFFVEPTIFRNVSPGARVARDEIFGPVLCVTAFDDEAEAVRIANGTTYGLSAYVWTASLSTGMRMSKKIRSSVRINEVPPLGEGAGFAISGEPSRQSGVGVEGGLAGMKSYLRRHRTSFNYS